MEQSIALMNYDPYSLPTSADTPKIRNRAKKAGSYLRTGELLDETAIIVLSRLKALQSVRPQLSYAAIIKRIIIWREWCRHWNSYTATATAVGMYYRRGRSRQHIYYIMHRMRADAILIGLA